MAEFNIPSMSCGGCAASITAAIKAVDANATVVANPATKLVSVTSSVSDAALRQTLADAGYPAQ